MREATGKEPWLSFAGRRRLPMVRQETVSECGLACVAMLAGYHGDATDLSVLRRKHGASLNGVTLAGIMRVCRSRHLTARAIRCEVNELHKLRAPCILHWEFKHFVVLSGVRGDALLLHDPAVGSRTVSLHDAGIAFTGVALEVTPSPTFRRREPARRLGLIDLVTTGATLRRVFPAAMLLALIAELFLLATPFYLQAVIDQVLVKGDRSLLDVLAAGFALLLLFQVLAMTMRRLLFQYLSQTTIFDMSSRVLQRLLRLPLDYFHRRELGDIQQRLQALSAIRTFLTQSAPAMLLDGMFLLLVGFMLFVYAPVMSAAVVATLLLYAAWRWGIFHTMFMQAHAAVRAEAATQTHLLETLRSAQTIKMCAGEARRASDWQNLFADKVNAVIRVGNLQIADAAVHHLMFQGLHVVIIYLLAQKALRGEMSIGQVSAYMAYLGMFVMRASGIVNRIVELKLLQVPLQRLADIVFHETEPDRASAAAQSHRFSGSVALRAIAYRHAEHDPPVLSACTVQVSRGEFIAIRGRSGCGKSTLLRLLAGLAWPSAGQLLYDGRPAADWAQSNLRRSIGTVLQGDVLLSGSIADNIALFADACDMRRVRRAAQSAMIDDYIEALPMAYQTRIGDLGSAFSVGQTQRILLARALYRRPCLLLLDEITGALDADTERQVVASLRRLDATRILVTHSEVVMRAADRVVELVGGQLVSPGPAQSRYAGGIAESSCR